MASKSMAWAEGEEWRLFSLPNTRQLVYVMRGTREDKALKQTVEWLYDTGLRRSTVSKETKFRFVVGRRTEGELKGMLGQENLKNTKSSGVAFTLEEDAWALLAGEFDTPAKMKRLANPKTFFEFCTGMGVPEPKVTDPLTAEQVIRIAKQLGTVASPPAEEPKTVKKANIDLTKMAYWLYDERTYVSSWNMPQNNYSRLDIWGYPVEGFMRLRSNEAIIELRRMAEAKGDGLVFLFAELLRAVQSEIRNVDGASGLRNDLNATKKQLNDLTESNNKLVPAVDTFQKQIEQIMELLNREGEARAKLADAADEEASDEDNPFKSPWSDGKSQIAMLKRGLIEPRVDFERVILPEDLKESILKIGLQQEAMTTIYDDWGFGETVEKGRGSILCFTGDPGTGKTMAAEGLAKRLGYLFWNIKSGNLESGLMGDFEKGVAFVFKQAKKIQDEHKAWEEKRTSILDMEIEVGDEAITIRNLYANGGDLNGRSLDNYLVTQGLPAEPPKGVVLLFDEADSIVAARDVRNPDGSGYSLGPTLAGQVNFILGELEEFEGVCIFATNRQVMMDEALQSRIALTVEFPFPDKAAREQIWRGLIPAKAPLADDINFAKLAEHKLAGRHIKNAVLNAARDAALNKSTHITQAHFLVAIKGQLTSKEVYSGEKATPKISVQFIGGNEDMMNRIMRGSDKPWLN